MLTPPFKGPPLINQRFSWFNTFDKRTSSAFSAIFDFANVPVFSVVVVVVVF